MTRMWLASKWPGEFLLLWPAFRSTGKRKANWYLVTANESQADTRWILMESVIIFKISFSLPLSLSHFAKSDPRTGPHKAKWKSLCELCPSQQREGRRMKERRRERERESWALTFKLMLDVWVKIPFTEMLLWLPFDSLISLSLPCYRSHPSVQMNGWSFCDSRWSIKKLRSIQYSSALRGTYFSLSLSLSLSLFNDRCEWIVFIIQWDLNGPHLKHNWGDPSSNG